MARAKPDGHTIYVHGASGLAANMHLFKKPPVDVAKAIQVAGTINVQPFMLNVSAKSPYQNVGEIYKALTGIQAIEVSYRTGADSLNELSSGKLDYAMLDAD